MKNVNENNLSIENVTFNGINIPLKRETVELLKQINLGTSTTVADPTSVDKAPTPVTHSTTSASSVSSTPDADDSTDVTEENVWLNFDHLKYDGSSRPLYTEPIPSHPIENTVGDMLSEFRQELELRQKEFFEVCEKLWKIVEDTASKHKYNKCVPTHTDEYMGQTYASPGTIYPSNFITVKINSDCLYVSMLFQTNCIFEYKKNGDFNVHNGEIQRCNIESLRQTMTEIVNELVKTVLNID